MSISIVERIRSLGRCSDGPSLLKEEALMEDDQGFSPLKWRDVTVMPNHAQLPRKRGAPICPAKNVPHSNSLTLSSISEFGFDPSWRAFKQLGRMCVQVLGGGRLKASKARVASATPIKRWLSQSA